MAKYLFKDLTDYTEQTLNNILEGIDNCIGCSEEIKRLFEETISELTLCNYWIENVPWNFREFSQKVPNVLNTFISDLSLIKSSIEKDCISNRDIKILENIGKVAYENEEYCWRFYKDVNNEPWKDYDNSKFRKVEKLYQYGRETFITLHDISNAVPRLKDYIKEEKTVVNVSKTDNSIHIGNNNKINNSMLGNNNLPDNKKENKYSKYFWKLVIPILVTVIATIILTWLNLK